MIESLQERYAPRSICFGCGPANDKGLRIRSVLGDDGELLCEFSPAPHHRAFRNVVNGGILGALLDCHSNWAAAHALMQARGDGVLPPTVTGNFNVRLRRPTPADQPLLVRASVHKLADPKVVVDAYIESGGVTTATCRGTFIAVGEDHPAHHRWGEDEG